MHQQERPRSRRNCAGGDAADGGAPAFAAGGRCASLPRVLRDGPRDRARGVPGRGGPRDSFGDDAKRVRARRVHQPREAQCQSASEDGW